MFGSFAGRGFYFAFFRFAAQYAFMRSTCALRCEALRRLRTEARAGVATTDVFFGVLPRRLAEA